MIDKKKVQEGQIFLADVKTQDGKKDRNYVVVEEFNERFGVSSGLAYKVLGFHQLIHPLDVDLLELITEEEIASKEFVMEIHKQGEKYSIYYWEKLLEKWKEAN